MIPPELRDAEVRQLLLFYALRCSREVWVPRRPRYASKYDARHNVRLDTPTGCNALIPPFKRRRSGIARSTTNRTYDVSPADTKCLSGWSRTLVRPVPRSRSDNSGRRHLGVQFLYVQRPRPHQHGSADGLSGPR